MRVRKGANDGEFTLNITSLMDILTIVLIYLVMGFSSEENEVEPPKDIMLPHSTTERQAKVNLTVSIAGQEVRVEGVVVAKLTNGMVSPKELDANKQIPSLLKELQKQQARLREQASSQSEEARKENDIVYVEADKGIAYETIDRVLKTAASAGFTRFRLAAYRTG